MNNLLLYYESALTQRVPEVDMVLRWLRKFELFIGFRPFSVQYPADADVPELRLSRPGMLAAVLQILAFFVSNIVVFAMGPKEASVNENEMADIAFDAISIMYLLNAVFIFSLVFIQRQNRLRIVPLERCIDAHLQQLPIDWTSFHRNLRRYLWIALCLTVTITGLAFSVELYVWSASTPLDFQYLVPFFAIATIMPFLYAEVVTIQFCLNVMFLKFLTDQTNGVMRSVCDAESFGGDRKSLK